MSKSVPPKEQPRQPQSRATTGPAAGAKAPASPAGAQASEPRTRAPQVSRPKTVESPSVPHEQIAVRAYQIWLDRGQPDGTDLENWFEAERQLTARR